MSKSTPPPPTPEPMLSGYLEHFDDGELDAFATACGILAAAQREGTGQFYKRSDDGGRAAAIIQLNAAICFIEAFCRGNGELTMPLQALLLALRDLDAGAVAPIVKPKALSNRPPDISSRKITRIYAVATMQLLIGLRQRL